jgi:hypothetical protein
MADPTKLEYDATVNKGRRKAPSQTITAEHVQLPASKRSKLLATVQDQVRNAATLAWMVRHHLDYVARFRFQFRSGNEQLDSLMERYFDWHGRPANFDIARRLGREEAFRMFEAEKVTAGDAAMVMLATGQLQAVESDMIAFPKIGPREKRGVYGKVPKEVALVDKDTGVLINNYGAIDKFCICNRGWDGKQVAFDHLEGFENVIFDGYFTRFSSQVRGISPLSTAVNTIQDLYEGFEWNLLKAKIHAIFGVAIMRDYAATGSDQEEVSSLGAASGITTGTDEAMTQAAETDAGTKSISSSLQKLTPDSLLMVDMDTRGRIEMLESSTPSNEFQAFSEMMTRIAMLALDIPYSAFNTAQSSFSAMIADNNLYEVSCRHKRDKNKWKRHEYSDWLIRREWEAPGAWELKAAAEAAGITRLRDLQEKVEWIPSGAPWLQKLQEVQGDIKAISCALDNPIDICQRRGGDVFKNIDKIAEVNAYAKLKGVPIMVGESGQATVEEITGQDTPQDSAPNGDNSNE